MNNSLKGMTQTLSLAVFCFGMLVSNQAFAETMNVPNDIKIDEYLNVNAVERNPNIPAFDPDNIYNVDLLVSDKASEVRNTFPSVALPSQVGPPSNEKDGYGWDGGRSGGGRAPELINK
jgi:hypothetical protein